MEAESRSTHMRIHSMGRVQFGLLFLVFTILFLICIIVGVTGPEARKQLTDDAYRCPEEIVIYDPKICSGVDVANNGTWSGQIKDLTLFNQEIELEIQIENMLFPNQAQDITAQITFRVDIEGSNDPNLANFTPVTSNDVHTREIICTSTLPHCDAITLARIISIDYKTYRFRVSAEYNPDNVDFFGDIFFTFDFGNASYAEFELSFRMVFLAISIVVVIFFSYALRKIPWRNWTLEQQWTLGLLLGLIGYDNPFFPINVTVGGWFPVFLDQLLLVSFVAMLMFFWIIMYDGLRLDGMEKTFVRFYLPKVVVVGIFWICAIVVYTWFSLHEMLDPVYSTEITANQGFVFFTVILAIVAVGYVVYVIWAVGKAYRHSRTLPLISLRLKVLGVFSGMIIVAVAVGIVFNFVGSRSQESSEFLTYLGLFNLYVYLLVYVYLPAPHAEQTQGVVGMMKLDEKTEGEPKENPSPHDPSDDAMDIVFLDDALKSNM